MLREFGDRTNKNDMSRLVLWVHETIPFSLAKQISRAKGIRGSLYHEHHKVDVVMDPMLKTCWRLTT